MTRTLLTRISVLGVSLLALGSTGCGDLVRQGRGPSQVVIMSLVAASGADPERLGGTLHSDVITNVTTTINGTQTTVPTIFSDSGQVIMSLLLKDPGQPGIASTPSAINQVTFTRYRVTYRRADGRNVPGVDVPHAFDGALNQRQPDAEAMGLGAGRGGKGLLEFVFGNAYAGIGNGDFD